MKRSLLKNIPTPQESDLEGEPSTKVRLVEREECPNGVALVNSRRVATKTYQDMMEIEDNLAQASSFNQANAKNKLDMIGRQMKGLQDLMYDVIKDTQKTAELNGAACNFVKKPGHVYHLYERPSGQTYFSMLSPEEWQNCPHKHLDSWRLEADYSWTKAGEENERYIGLTYLKDLLSGQIKNKAILGKHL